MVLLTASLLLAPIAFILVPGSGVVEAAGQSRAPNVIATTLAFFNGQVVTVQYSNIYFCNSPGPATSSSSSPCAVGADATVDPVPDTASNTLDVIIPFFKGLGAGFAFNTLGSSGLPSTDGIFDPTLGANSFTQCPDNTSTLTCPNHPNFLDLAPAFGASPLVTPLPIHSHVLSNGNPTSVNQGGWWKLRVWLVLDSTIWPNPSTGACTAGTGCLTSLSALSAAAGSIPPKAIGPVPTTIYLFFNVVSSNSK